MKLKKGDFFIAIILIIAVLGWFGKDMIFADDANKNVNIKIDGQIYTTFKLDSNERKDILIDLADGHEIRVIAEDGQIWVEESTCPDEVCVETGKISKRGESIVCLPNKTVVYIDGANEMDVDDVSN